MVGLGVLRVLAEQARTARLILLSLHELSLLRSIFLIPNYVLVCFAEADGDGHVCVRHV